MAPTPIQSLTRREAAAMLRLSVRALESFAARGLGPPYYQFGRAIRYRKTDLDAWARARLHDPLHIIQDDPMPTKAAASNRRQAARAYATALRACAHCADDYALACSREEIAPDLVEAVASDSMRALAKQLDREATTGERRVAP